jgi:hypothetical protein
MFFLWTIAMMMISNKHLYIEFVRNAPSSMRWFRSDLTPENMEMPFNGTP